MKIIRKVIIGKEILPPDAMSYSVGQKVYRGQYLINSIVRKEDDTIVIYIENEGEIMVWKEINKHVATTIEYSLDFS